jgi:hypothetical protein
MDGTCSPHGGHENAYTIIVEMPKKKKQPGRL